MIGWVVHKRGLLACSAVVGRQLATRLRITDTVPGLHRKAAVRREAEGARLQSVRIYFVSLA